MTPVLCCGFECGVKDAHWTTDAAVSFVTTGQRDGARALRCNPTAATAGALLTNPLTSYTRLIARIYVFFTTLPNADVLLFGPNNASGPQVRFKQSDSKIYAAVGTTLGASGVSVTTGQWYRIDCHLNINTGGNDTADVQIDGSACGQATATGLSAGVTGIFVGDTGTSHTGDYLFDSLVCSNTAADYPIGAGFVNAFIPASDGTHNVAGANDFERSATGTDITNSTTDAFALINKQPVDVTTAAPTIYINLVAPPNATDYVECVYGSASGSARQLTAPRAVEVLVGYAASATGVCNIRLALNDNGTTSDVFNGNPATTNTNVRYTSKQYATPPTGGTWTSELSGSGSFENLRIRCLTNDATPDPFFACTMVEAEFALPSDFPYNDRPRHNTLLRM